MRILFPAAGGEPIMAALHALREKWEGPGDLYCIGSDMVSWKGALLSLDEFHVAPSRMAAEYIPYLLDLCKRRQIDLVWPNPTEEQLAIEPHRDLFESKGIRLLMPPGNAVRLLANKAATYEYAASQGVDTPEFRKVDFLASIENHARALGYPDRPVVFRRVEGRGGIGVRILEEGPGLARELFEAFGGGRRMMLDALLNVLGEATTFPDCMVCEYLPGREYDVDCLCDGQNLVHAIVRRNDEMLGGTSMLAEVVDRPDLIDMAKKLLESLKWRYICSVSFREDRKGNPKLLEVNPRIPSSINLTWKAGCNMPLAALKMCLGISPTVSSRIRYGMKIVRYLGEVFIPPQ